MGRSHCELLSERGASIVLCDLDGDVAQEAAAAIVAAGGRAVAAATDVGDRAQCEALVALAVEAFGGIDVLVHNAGRLPCGARLEDTDDDDWHALFAVNVDGPDVPHARRAAAPAQEPRPARDLHLLAVGAGRPRPLARVHRVEDGA